MGKIGSLSLASVGRRLLRLQVCNGRTGSMSWLQTGERKPHLGKHQRQLGQKPEPTESRW